MNWRDNAVSELEQTQFDVLILGGGINGAVAAAALAAQGVSVALIERGDFAAGSSSNSSNLAWGGIKYMESGEWLLVRKLCQSRNHLMRHYPSAVKEIRFLTTISKGFRWPPFFIYMGSLLYWFIGACATKAPRYLTANSIGKEEPIINTDNVSGGTEYSDCYLPGNDARFVYRFIADADGYGATVINYVAASGSTFDEGSKIWSTTATDSVSGRSFTIKSKGIINACGAYVDSYNANVGISTKHRHLFSKGVHLIVPRLTEHERIMAFFASDGRLFFIIPMGNLTCIGTTDTPVNDPHTVVTDEDREFILDNANQLLRLPQPLSKADIVAERCGVRPLAVQRGKDTANDWLALSRRHQVDCDVNKKFISVFGGKITDCVNVGAELVDYCAELGLAKRDSSIKWYGEPSAESRQRFLDRAAGMQLLEPGVSQPIGEPVAERWWRRFGESAHTLLDAVEKDGDALCRPMQNADYCRCEIQLMGQKEFIVELDDFLRRRTKIALSIPSKELIAHPGLIEVATLLFGEDAASEKVRHYTATISA